MSLVKFNQGRSPLWRNSLLSDPFISDLLDSRRWNRLFDGNDDDLGSSPAINVREKEKDIQLEMAAPGLSKDDFKITLDQGMLTVSAEKQDKYEEEKEGFVRKEFSYNSFSRSLQLPETVDENKEVEATYKDGILRLKLHKKEGITSKEPKAIRVK